MSSMGEKAHQGKLARGRNGLGYFSKLFLVCPEDSRAAITGIHFKPKRGWVLKMCC